MNFRNLWVWILACIAGLALAACSSREMSLKSGNQKIAIVIHGGAGNITPENISKENELAYRLTIDSALMAGYRILQEGGSSLDAVEATINILENSPLFNAGKGAVLNADGQSELDASVMQGWDLSAGAVAGLHRIKNPISGAIKVMQLSPHVLMVGDGAEKFLTENGVELVDPGYFITPERLERWKKLKYQSDTTGLNYPLPDWKYGTVGCVALDQKGNITAGTSTGGMMMKKYGRVGDSPIIGAGTYANNKTCGISCTGHGEYFIRSLAAHSISELIAYQHYSIQKAGDEVLKRIELLGGTGGMIILNQKGEIYMPFNTQGMFRGYIDTSGKKEILMFGSGNH